MLQISDSETGNPGTLGRRGECVVPGREACMVQAPPGPHQATDHGRVDGREACVGQAPPAPNATDLGQAATRRKWTIEDNRQVMECYFKNRPAQRGYRQRMLQIWKASGGRHISEQRLVDQAYKIKKKQWFSSVELEEIERLPREDSANHTNSQQIAASEAVPPSQQPRNEEPVTEDLDESQLQLLEKLNNYRNSEMDIIRLPKLKRIPKKQLMSHVQKIDALLEKIPTANITETNRLIYACAKVVTEKLEIGEKKHESHGDPPWKKRLHGQIQRLLDDLSRLQEWKNGTLQNQRERERLNRKHRVTQKGLQVVTEEMKQRVTALAARLQRYEARVKQWRQNRLFRTNQRQLYDELSNKTRGEQVVPNAEESREFWGQLWDRPGQHNKDARWLTSQKEEGQGVPQQANVEITPDILKALIKRMPNWKSPGPDEVHGFWIKNLTSLHTRITNQL
mgnify:CR=1 FL=1